MRLEQKYAKVEWERRFLLDRFPAEAEVTRLRSITDRYIEATNLRLRRLSEGEKPDVFKLTQKLADRTREEARQGWITTMYLTHEEFRVLANLTARVLIKTRHSIPPFGIDVFEGELCGLILAEAEFDSSAEASALTLPSFVSHEVTNDLRFTGGSLASASRQNIREWLEQFGIRLQA